MARVDLLEEFGSYSTEVNSARVQSIPKSTRRENVTLKCFYIFVSVYILVYLFKVCFCYVI